MLLKVVSTVVDGRWDVSGISNWTVEVVPFMITGVVDMSTGRSDHLVSHPVLGVYGTAETQTVRYSSTKKELRARSTKGP